MNLKGAFQTTAMGILPHTNIGEAMKLALSVDIPFWPQLPKVNFYEDMYVQVTENFPGITIEVEKQKINFNLNDFYEGLSQYIEHLDDQSYFELSKNYSKVYTQFLELDLTNFHAIRGQSIGPISFGMKITDENKKPIIYNEEVKGFLYEFISKKLNAQYHQLVKKNSNAFVWIDEPGLEIIFGSFTGYSAETAKKDFAKFLGTVEGPKGVHLCGNPDWSFLLTQAIDILSLDVFGCGHIFTRYHQEIREFLKRGGIISWGIVPTLTGELEQETLQKLIKRVEEFFNFLCSKGISKEVLAQQAWLAPARCCLINSDKNVTVENSYALLRELSNYFKERYLG